MTLLEATTAIEGTRSVCFKCNHDVDELDDRCQNCHADLVVTEDEDEDDDGDDLDADDYDLGGEGSDEDEDDFPDRFDT